MSEDLGFIPVRTTTGAKKQKEQIEINKPQKDTAQTIPNCKGKKNQNKGSKFMSSPSRNLSSPSSDLSHSSLCLLRLGNLLRSDSALRLSRHVQGDNTILSPFCPVSSSPHLLARSANNSVCCLFVISCQVAQTGPKVIKVA